MFSKVSERSREKDRRASSEGDVDLLHIVLLKNAENFVQLRLLLRFAAVPPQRERESETRGERN